MVRQGAALLAIAISVGSMGIAPAGAADGVKMQALLNQDGTGRLFVNDGREGWSWEACTPDLSSCTPFGTGRDITIAGARPNTVFRVSGGGDTGLSPVWRGNLISLSPPSVRGAVRANELVTPIAGSWQGGWEGEGDSFQLAACDGPSGNGCTTLTHSHYADGCNGEAAVLDPVFTGDYLRVADERIGAGPHYMPMWGASSPYGWKIWLPGPTLSVAIAGRIAKATGPRTEGCGPPPLVEASISKRGVATAECLLDCRVALIARRDGRMASVVRELPVESRRGSRTRVETSTTLRLSPRSLMRLGSGRAQMVLKVDGRTVARRTVLLLPRHRAVSAA